VVPVDPVVPDDPVIDDPVIDDPVEPIIEDPLEPDVPDVVDPPVPPPPPPDPPVVPIVPTDPRARDTGATSYPVAPRPVIPTRDLRNPSVTMNLVDLDPSLGPFITNPMEDFEIDRELGLVQQSDVFGPYERDGLPTDASLSYSPTLTDADVNPIELTDQDLLEMALFDMLAQQLLTRGPRGMVDDFTVQQ